MWRAVCLMLLTPYLQATPSPATLYERVLESIREQHPSKRLVLSPTIANITCVDTCQGQPTLGTHAPEWAARLQSAGLIAGVCETGGRASCSTPGLEAAPEHEVQVTLSDVRLVGSDSAEVVGAHSVWGTACRLCAYTVRYGFRRSAGGDWRITSSDTLDVAWLQ